MVWKESHRSLHLHVGLRHSLIGDLALLLVVCVNEASRSQREIASIVKTATVLAGRSAMTNN